MAPPEHQWNSRQVSALRNRRKWNHSKNLVEPDSVISVWIIKAPWRTNTSAFNGKQTCRHNTIIINVKYFKDNQEKCDDEFRFKPMSWRQGRITPLWILIEKGGKIWGKSKVLVKEGKTQKSSLWRVCKGCNLNKRLSLLASLDSLHVMIAPFGW